KTGLKKGDGENWLIVQRLPRREFEEKLALVFGDVSSQASFSAVSPHYRQRSLASAFFGSRRLSAPVNSAIFEPKM
ncbi:hypothetical protein, partial [Stutzerimonas kunmingensis]|uniref:hypothetical protein n=1 Tax=Stutzerimonas kunmingensis TaxID=1211807 RepID=UPI0028A9FAC4